MSEQKQHLLTEVLKLNNRIKEISEDNQRENPTLHKELQILKEERENLSREPEEANEQKRDEIKVLQGKNEERKVPIKRQTSDVHSITVELMKEKRHFEKSQEDWEQTKKNLTCEKEADSEAKLDAKKQINKSKYELEKQDTHTSEGISSLGETNNAGRPRSKALINEGQRPRNMSRSKCQVYLCHPRNKDAYVCSLHCTCILPEKPILGVAINIIFVICANYFQRSGTPLLSLTINCNS